MICGRCLEVCPLYAASQREELSPKAKFNLRKLLREPGQSLNRKAAAALSSICLGCGKCAKICPQGLSGLALVAQARAAHPGWESLAYGLWLKNARLLWPLAGKLAKRLQGPGLAGKRKAGRLTLWLSDLNSFSLPETLKPWLALKDIAACARQAKAVIFPGCAANSLLPLRRERAAQLALKAGFSLAPALDFNCCGGSLGQAGLFTDQLSAAGRNLKLWRESGRPRVLVFCASCLYSLQAYADLPLDFEPGEAAAWREALTPLAARLDPLWFRLLDNAPEVAHYHQPCHAGQPDADLEFLRGLLGERLKFRSARNLCCGFAGLLKLSQPKLSAAAARRCLEFYAAKPREQILSGCTGCVTQLGAQAQDGLSVAHWLDIISI